MVLSKSHGERASGRNGTIHMSSDGRNFAHRSFVYPATWSMIQWMRCSVKGAESERFMEGGRRRQFDGVTAIVFQLSERERERSSSLFVFTHSLSVFFFSFHPFGLRRGSSHPLAHISILSSSQQQRRFKPPPFPPHLRRRRLRTPHISILPPLMWIAVAQRLVIPQRENQGER